ncbi:class I SAM-dependent methyltransferase [Desulfocurvus sp. DL9XJH121]
MTVLKGCTRESNTTGELYGNYSFGNMYEQILNEQGIERLKDIVAHDLRTAGVFGRLPKMRMMDVGTGRQALSMALLGAGSVDHYDISHEHVARFSDLLRARFPELPVKTRRLDLCLEGLPTGLYDFVYLSGIVQHFSDPAQGLRNCAGAVKQGGLIWIYFYRSGTFKWFVAEMIRSLLSVEDLDRFFYSSAQIYAAGDITNPVTSQIMDDFFAPYIHLFSPQDYMEFMRLLGFRLASSSHADPLSSCNHDMCHHSAVLVFQREDMQELDLVETGDLLKPSSDVYQLNPDLYDDDQSKELIALFDEVRSLLERKGDDVFRFSLCIALHRIAGPQYYGDQELPPKRNELKGVLLSARQYLLQV